MVAQAIVSVVAEAGASAVVETVVAMMTVAVVSVVTEHAAIDGLQRTLLHMACLQALIERLALLMRRVVRLSRCAVRADVACAGAEWDSSGCVGNVAVHEAPVLAIDRSHGLLIRGHWPTLAVVIVINAVQQHGIHG